jgi:competence protein ComEC
VHFLQSVQFNLFLIAFSGCLWPFLNHLEHKIGLLLGLLLYNLACNLVCKKSYKTRLIYLVFFIGMLGYATVTKSHHNALTRSGYFNQIVTVIEPQFSRHQSTVLVKDPDNLLWQLQVNKLHLDPLRYGDQYQVSGPIKSAKKATNPGQFNKARWLALKGISGQIIPKKIRKIPHHSKWDLKRLQFAIKSKVLAYHQHMLPPPFSDLFTGLIFGDHGTRLPLVLKTIFKKTGLTHLLVVSGSQVSLIVGIIFLALTYLRLPRMGIMGTIIIINIIFYGVTGGGASVLRAILMSMIIVGFKLYHYQSSTAHVITTVAVIMMIINPLIIFDLGAYLSFLATLSLIYGVPWISDRLPQGWPLFIRLSVSMSIAPFIFTFPFLWGFLYKLSLISILTNLIMVPIIEIIVVLGFFTTIIGIAIPIITTPMMTGMEIVLRGMILFIKKMAAISWAEIPLGAPSIIVIILIYGLLWICLSSLSPSKKKKLISSGIALLLGGWLWSSLQPAQLVITILDVGQGDATLIECPNGKTILIDSGSGLYPDAGRNIIGPYLAYRGINRIDVVVITHYDFDHYGGLKSLSEIVEISQIIDNGNLEKHEKIKSWIPTIKDIKPIHQFDTLQIDPSVKITCLSPFSKRSHPRSHHNKNNRSVTLLIQYKDIDILLPGDLEALGEKFLVQNHSPIDIEVLKLGHHGSKTSTTADFLKWSTPEIGIISAGRNNRYGHPHPTVMSRCRNNNMTLYRTDQQGAITLTTDGKSIQIRPYINRYKILDLM